MELNLLYFIQSWHNPTLDKIMVFIFNDIVGDKGQLWVWLGLVFFIYPKSRKVGISMLLSYLIAYFIGDNILKDLIARPRPCQVDETIELLVKRSTSYSCPSVHSMLAFATSSAVYLHKKKPGIILLIFSVLVAFSRMYFFVHYLTDVLFGAVLGILIAYLVYRLLKK